MNFWILEKKQISQDNVYVIVSGPNTDGEILAVEKKHLTNLQITATKLKNSLDMLPKTNNVIFNDKIRELSREIDELLRIR